MATHGSSANLISLEKCLTEKRAALDALKARRDRLREIARELEAKLSCPNGANECFAEAWRVSEAAQRIVTDIARLEESFRSASKKYIEQNGKPWKAA